MSAAGSPTAHSIIEHLQDLGHYVIGHDSSRFITETAANQHVRSPAAIGGGYMRFLQGFADVADLYLPFLDEELRIFGIAGAPSFALCSPVQTLITFTDKALQQRAMYDAGLPVAPEADVIFKPAHGRGGKGIFKSNLFAGFLVQKHINGTEFTIDVLTDRDGKFLYALPRTRLVTNGVSIIGRVGHANEMHQDLVDLAERVTQAFKFAGPVNIQVIASMGELYIIEVNARLAGSCIFSVLAGWDILEATIRVAVGLPFVEPTEIKPITVRRYYLEEVI